MRIFITGGSSGLGKAIVEMLSLEKKNKIFFTYCKSFVSAEKIEKTLENVEKIHLDFSNEKSISNLLKRIPDLNCDVLVNNAYSSYEYLHFRKIDYRKIDKSFRVNVMPTLRISQAMINLFISKKFGKVINILSSYLVSNPPLGLSEYVANKAYLLSMNKSWATEYASLNITSNAVSPSIMRNNFTKDIDERILEIAEKKHPFKKFLLEKEVCDTIKFIIESPQHLNGQNIILNAAENL
jgi:3-oxoacyl-[acyl-carrier protein] reductase